MSVSSTPAPTAVAQLQWFDNRDVSFQVDSQTGEVRLNVKLQLYSYRAAKSDPAQKFLLVSLEGSEVKPTHNHLDKDQDDIRGYYTEDITVGIGFDDAAAGELVLRQDSPDTTTQTGSVSSSVSLSLDAGFFGDTPTATVGASISNSFSANLSDFAVVNRSTEEAVLHEIMLAMTRDGHPYRNPKDLVDMTPGGQFSGCPLFPLPDRAVSNVPLVSQALFWAREPIVDDRTLRISVNVRLRKVEKTFQFFSVHVQDWSHTVSDSWTFPIPFGRVD